MKLFSSLLVTFLLAALGSFRYVSSIICYDCNSEYDPRCGENFDSFSLGVVNCSLKDRPEHIPDIAPTLCRTIKMELSGKVRVVRQCGYLADESEWNCRRQSGNGELYVTYCSCNTDLCNDAYANHYNVATLVLVAGLCLLVRRF